MTKTKTRLIFTKKLAIYLRKQGFKILGTDINYNHPEYDVWIFEDTPELTRAILNYSNK